MFQPRKHRRFGLPWTGPYWRREPLSGLTTLALLAILAAFVVTRVMRRIGLGMQRNTTFAFMFAFVVLVLMLWGSSFNK
jgi:Co/Zn/Cd efflux system component